MKIAYKGYLYEENYHFDKTGYFNKEFQSEAMVTVKELIPQIDKLLNSPISYVPTRLKVSNKELPKVFFHNKVRGNSEATVERYEGGILLRFNDMFFNSDISLDKLESLLFHEVTHIYQIAKGVYDFEDEAPSGTDDEMRFRYYNDPKEINALINSFIMYVSNNKEARDYLKKVSLDEFYKKAFLIMGKDEEELKEFMEEGAIIAFYESLGFLRSKMRQGEYD